MLVLITTPAAKQKVGMGAVLIPMQCAAAMRYTAAPQEQHATYQTAPAILKLKLRLCRAPMVNLSVQTEIPAVSSRVVTMGAVLSPMQCVVQTRSTVVRKATRVTQTKELVAANSLTSLLGGS